MSGAKQPAGDRVNNARVISNKGKGNRRVVPSAKAKAKAELESRTVFKAVLDNPFEVKWPVIPPNIQNALLARVSELLAGIADYNNELSRNRSRRHKRKQEHASAKPDTLSSKEDGEVVIDNLKPAILEHLAVGINEVTKRLETQCSIRRTPLLSVTPKNNPDLASNPSPSGQPDNITSNSNSNKSSNPLRAIFICRADLSTPQLAEHIPTLVAAVNSRLTEVRSRALRQDASTSTFTSTNPIAQSDKRDSDATRVSSRDEAIMSIDTLADADGVPKSAYDPEEREPGMLVERRPSRPTLFNATRVVLVPLPRGAEEVLKQATGLKHVSVLAFDTEIDSDPQAASLLSQIPTLTAPWLTPRSTSYLPTSIRLKQTTAPKDMRASKAARAAARGAAKARRRATLASEKAKRGGEAKAKAVAKKSAKNEKEVNMEI